MTRILAATFIFWISSAAVAASLSVGSIANIFGAGQVTPPGGTMFGAGILPPHVSFPAEPGRVLRVTNVSGFVGSAITGIGNFAADLDGHAAVAVGTNINAQQGIAGIKADGALFLCGVFLDASAPTGAPPLSLDFTSAGLGETFLELSPHIGQVFFIGDGKSGTNSGALQNFVIPSTATRLFMGFADGIYNGAVLAGDPDTYTSNVGGLGVSFEFVPEPANLSAFAVAALCAALRNRRCNHRPR